MITTRNRGFGSRTLTPIVLIVLLTAHGIFAQASGPSAEPREKAERKWPTPGSRILWTGSVANDGKEAVVDALVVSGRVITLSSRVESLLNRTSLAISGLPLRDGESVWRRPLRSEYCALAARKNVVFVGTPSGVSAVEPSSGGLVWEANRWNTIAFRKSNGKGISRKAMAVPRPE